MPGPVSRLLHFPKRSNGLLTARCESVNSFAKQKTMNRGLSMGKFRSANCGFLTVSLLMATSGFGQAAEYGFSTYALGESAFSAGLTPPPGTYVTAVTG